MLLQVGGAELALVENVRFHERAMAAGVDVQFPWEEAPRRHHRIEIDVAPFYIDRHPVTNAEFKRFIDATGYRPADAHTSCATSSAAPTPKDGATSPSRG